jgi:hypothetical protein
VQLLIGVAALTAFTTSFRPCYHSLETPLAQQLFLATPHITADAAEYFGPPGDRTVIIGSRIDL